MPKKIDHAHMNAAEGYAKLSHARRLQVGAIITKDDRVISIGYNGTPAGWDNNCEDTFYEEDIGHKYTKTKPEVLHAETNAVAKVARSTNSTDGADIFVTHAPCIECAKLIHQSGIKRLFYRDTYKNDDGLNFLNQCNVEVNCVKELHN